MTESLEYQHKKYSRRNFLRGAVGGLLATGVGTVGCIERVGDYLKKRERDDRKISLGELKNLGKVDVYYPNGSTVELYATDYPYKYYDNSGYQVFFEGKEGKIVLDSPKVQRKFSNKIVLHGSDQFRGNVENMLDYLGAYSGEWFEKTLYAGEVIKLSKDIHYGLRDGTIGIPEGTAELGGSKDVKQVLSVDAIFAHEGWHVIDQNLYPRFFHVHSSLSDPVDDLELELRAGIADDVYKMEVSEKMQAFYDFLGSEKGYPGHFKTRNIVSEFYLWRDSRFKLQKQKVDQAKYKDRLEKIEQTYFDHKNKKLKTDFLNESWEKFQKI